MSATLMQNPPAFSVRSPFRTPTHIDDLTPAWFTPILALKVPGAEVLSVQVEDEILGMAVKVRVRLTYNATGRAAGLPETLFVKAGFGRYPHEYEAMNYHIEAYAYAGLVPTLDVNAPKCYFAGIDDADRAVIVMEDLRPRGITFCRLVEPLTFGQAAAFLDAFARIHARWWDSPEFSPGGRLDFLSEMFDDSVRSANFWIDHCLQPEVWAQIMTLPRAMAVPKPYRSLSRMAAGMARLAEVWRAGPFCASQGDEHLGNLFLEADGRPGFYDWQSRKVPWSHSFSYFLIGALDMADRRKWEQALLSHYLSRLAHYGATPPAFDDAWLAYRQSALFGLFIFMCNEVAMQPEVNNTANAARFGHAVLDHDTFGALGV
jgi:hypothetical protein